MQNVLKHKSSGGDPIWDAIREETLADAANEPILASFLHATILNHDTLEAALSFHLANKLDSPTASALLLREVIEEAFRSSCSIPEAVREDLQAVRGSRLRLRQLLNPFSLFQGFPCLASSPYRPLPVAAPASRAGTVFSRTGCPVVFGVDIHPAAQIASGIMLDHATGIVIGETAVVGHNVSIMQSVTLGGTGKESGDRHPKVGDGVLIAAGAKVLGNITIGEGAMICAGSVVLQDVPPHTTVAGVPATVVGHPCCDQPALEMDQQIKEDYSI